MAKSTIFTIGHSTRTSDELVEALRAWGVETIADVRSYPGSRHCPHFGQAVLRQSLQHAGIGYVHLPEIGGRRHDQDPEERHAGWRVRGFRHYAAYAASSKDFRKGFNRLSRIASTSPTAMMCAEMVWWRCHRRILADYLLAAGWEVRHIFTPEKCEPASMTPFATAAGGVISYPAPGPVQMRLEAGE